MSKPTLQKLNALVEKRIAKKVFTGCELSNKEQEFIEFLEMKFIGGLKKNERKWDIKLNHIFENEANCSERYFKLKAQYKKPDTFYWIPDELTRAYLSWVSGKTGNIVFLFSSNKSQITVDFEEKKLSLVENGKIFSMFFELEDLILEVEVKRQSVTTLPLRRYQKRRKIIS